MVVDSGCTRTLVHKKYVSRTALTGNKITVLTAAGERLTVPLAKVEFDNKQGKHVELVGVLDKLPVDCLLGRSSFGKTLPRQNSLDQWEKNVSADEIFGQVGQFVGIPGSTASGSENLDESFYEAVSEGDFPSSESEADSVRHTYAARAASGRPRDADEHNEADNAPAHGARGSFHTLTDLERERFHPLTVTPDCPLTCFFKLTSNSRRRISLIASYGTVSRRPLSAVSSANLLGRV